MMNNGKRPGVELPPDERLILKAIRILRRKLIVVDKVTYLCSTLLDWRADTRVKRWLTQLGVLKPIGLFADIEQGNPRAAQVIKERLMPRPPRSTSTFCYFVNQERLDAVEAELKGRVRVKTRGG